MKKLLLGLALLISFSVVAQSNITGRCTSLKDSKYKLKFDVIRTDFEKNLFEFQGTRKAILGKKKFNVSSKFAGIKWNQFYSFEFAAPFIKESAYLLLRTENYDQTQAPLNDGFIVNQTGTILDSLACEDLSR
jgi:hypothetical protein